MVDPSVPCRYRCPRRTPVTWWILFSLVGLGLLFIGQMLPQKVILVGPACLTMGTGLSSSWEALRDCELRMLWLVLST